MTAVLDRDTTGAPGLAGRRRPLEPAFRAVLLASLVIAVVFLAVLLFYVLNEGWPRLDSRPMRWSCARSARRCPSCS